VLLLVSLLLKSNSFSEPIGGRADCGSTIVYFSGGKFSQQLELLILSDGDSPSFYILD